MPVTPGLILLGFLALLCAFFVTRARRRMGLGSSGRIWMLVIVGFVLIMLTAWVAQQK
jgi:1,4-dihydroxy-2-naphthoate octaprenyltransferase